MQGRVGHTTSSRRWVEWLNLNMFCIDGELPEPCRLRVNAWAIVRCNARWAAFDIMRVCACFTCEGIKNEGRLAKSLWMKSRQYVAF